MYVSLTVFDYVKHNLLISRLQDISIDDKDLRIIKQLYWEQSAEIRIRKDS